MAERSFDFPEEERADESGGASLEARRVARDSGRRDVTGLEIRFLSRMTH